MISWLVCWIGLWPLDGSNIVSPRPSIESVSSVLHFKGSRSDLLGIEGVTPHWLHCAIDAGTVAHICATAVDVVWSNEAQQV